MLGVAEKIQLHSQEKWNHSYDQGKLVQWQKEP